MNRLAHRICLLPGRAILGLIALPVLLSAQFGCASYNDRFTYTPRPALVTTTTENKDAGSVRAMVTVLGVDEADKHHDIPATVDVHLRLRNEFNGDVHFDPHSLALVDAAARPFDPPTVTPAGVVDIPKGGAVEVSAQFPFPPGKFPAGMDLRTLVLEWTVTLGSQNVAQSASFRRLQILYYDPYYEPYYYDYEYRYYSWPHHHSHFYWGYWSLNDDPSAAELAVLPPAGESIP